MKRIFILITSITIGSMVSCSDSKRVKKIEQTTVRRVIIAENPVDGFRGFDHPVDEINLNIPQLLIDNNNPVQSARDLINLGKTSKYFHALSQDKEVVNLMKNPILIALAHPRILHTKTQSLADADKMEFLTDVELIPSNKIQYTICRRLVQLSLPFFSTLKRHPILYSTVIQSNLPLFELCQQLLNASSRINQLIPEQMYLHYLKRAARRTIMDLGTERSEIYKKDYNSREGRKEIDRLDLLIQDAKAILEKLK